MAILLLKIIVLSCNVDAAGDSAERQVVSRWSTIRDPNGYLTYHRRKCMRSIHQFALFLDLFLMACVLIGVGIWEWHGALATTTQRPVST